MLNQHPPKDISTKKNKTPNKKWANRTKVRPKTAIYMPQNNPNSSDYAKTRVLQKRYAQLSASQI